MKNNMEGSLNNNRQDPAEVPAQENLPLEENVEPINEGSDEKKSSRRGSSSLLGKAAIGLAAMLGMAESVDGAGHNWHYGNGQNYSTPNNSQNYNYRGRQMPPNTAQYPVQGQGMNQNRNYNNHEGMVEGYLSNGTWVSTPGRWYPRGYQVGPNHYQNGQNQNQGNHQSGYIIPNQNGIGHNWVFPGEEQKYNLAGGVQRTQTQFSDADMQKKIQLDNGAFKEMAKELGYDITTQAGIDAFNRAFSDARVVSHTMNQQEVQHQKTLVALSGAWTLGTMTTEALHASAEPLAIGDVAKEMVRDISASGTEYNVSVHQVSVARLGLQDGATYDQILAAATAQGYSVCPPEVALQVAMQTDHALPNEEAIFVGMTAMNVGNGGQFIFAPEHGQDGNHLIAQSVGGAQGHAFRASNQFLFVK